MIHARVMRFEGRGPGWCGSPGRRVYTDRKDRAGAILMACGVKLDDAHAAEPFSWATIKSAKSRDRAFVTCPDCVRALAGAPWWCGPTTPPGRQAGGW